MHLYFETFGQLTRKCVAQTGGELAGHEVFERFYEIGSHEGLEDAIQFFKETDKETDKV